MLRKRGHKARAINSIAIALFQGPGSPEERGLVRPDRARGQRAPLDDAGRGQARPHEGPRPRGVHVRGPGLQGPVLEQGPQAPRGQVQRAVDEAGLQADLQPGQGPRRHRRLAGGLHR